MGASLPSTLFVPDYPPLKPFLEAAQPLIDEYPYLEFNPEKGDALLTAKGWTKDGNGMWDDETGKPVELEIISFFDFTCVGPVVVEQLEAGRDRRPPTPSRPISSTASTRASTPARCSATAAATAQTSTTRYGSTSPHRPRSLAGHLANFSLWHNEEYDKLVDELYGISPTETEKVMEIWKKALAIWLPELPDIQLTQGFHRLPTNTTYWTNWPDAENPYVNTAHFHLTWPLVVHMLQPAKQVKTRVSGQECRGDGRIGTAGRSVARVLIT